MLVVLEGLPGSGKTTALNTLRERSRLHTIDELLEKEPKTAIEAFYIQNDVNKYRRISPRQINLMDRNFASTLCYNYCSDLICGTKNYQYISKEIVVRLHQGLLWQPDLYILLSCTPATSHARQNQSNNNNWLNPAFIGAAQAFYNSYLIQTGSRIEVVDTEALSEDDVVCQIEQSINSITKRRRTYA